MSFIGSSIRNIIDCHPVNTKVYKSVLGINFGYKSQFEVCRSTEILWLEIKGRKTENSIKNSN